MNYRIRKSPFVTLNEMICLDSDHQCMLKSVERLIELYNEWIKLAKHEPINDA